MYDGAYGNVQVTKPASEPVSLSSVKSHLAIDVTDDDAYITAAITAARVLCETFTGRIFGSRTFRLTLPAWPKNGLIRFPVSPVSAIQSIAYTDVYNTPGVIDPANTTPWLDANPPQVGFILGFTYPVLSLNGGAPLVITYTAGEDDVNPMVPEAIKLAIAFWRDPKVGGLLDRMEGRGLPASAVSLLMLLWTGGL